MRMFKKSSFCLLFFQSELLIKFKLSLCHNCHLDVQICFKLTESLRIEGMLPFPNLLVPLKVFPIVIGYHFASESVTFADVLRMKILF